MKLETEISRIDCRLYNEDKLCYYFTIDRINKNSAMVSGITFSLNRSLIFQIIACVKQHGFKFIKFERPSRTVTYDIAGDAKMVIER